MPHRALRGKLVVITRPSGQAANLTRALRGRGARVVAAPVISIEPPRSYGPLDRALRRLETYDWVVFTSANAVAAFFTRARKLRIRPRVRFAAVGGATAKALARQRHRASFVSQESTGAALARSLPVEQGRRVLIPRALRAGKDLPAILRRRGARVDVVTAYRTVPDARGAARIRALAGGVHAVTFTSASTAEHLRRALGAARFRKLFSVAAAASIGPVTSAALKRYGARPVQAREASDEALAAALEAHFS